MNERKTYIEILADMERVSLHLLVVLLAFSHLIISSTAIPSTRAERLVKETRDIRVPTDTLQVITEEHILEEAIRGRMDVETNDYPGSGANNRHIPRPVGRR